MIIMRPCTELTFNQTSYEAGRRDERESAVQRSGEEIRRVYEILDRVWKFFVGADGSRLYLQVHFSVSASGEHWTGRKWLLSPRMTKSEIVQTAFKAVLTAVEHETRELFTYKGKRIFGPHFDVDALEQICDRLDVRK